MKLINLMLTFNLMGLLQAAVQSREDSKKSFDDDFYLVFSPIKNSKSSSQPAEPKQEEKAHQENRYGSGGYSHGAGDHHGYGGGASGSAGYGGGGYGGGAGSAGYGGGAGSAGYGGGAGSTGYGGGGYHSGSHDSYKTPYTESYSHYPSPSLFGEKVKIAALLTLVNLNVLALYLTYKLASSNVTIAGRSKSGWEYDLTCGACSYLSDLVSSTGAERLNCATLFSYCNSD